MQDLAIQFVTDYFIQFVTDYFIAGLLFAFYIFCWEKKPKITVLSDRRLWPLSLIPVTVVVCFFCIIAWPLMIFVWNAPKK